MAKLPSSETDPPQKTPSLNKFIRGSSLLFVGRLLAIALNFAGQVLMVRYLSKHDFGAFAFALSLISIGASLSLFGLDKAISRFLSIWEEQGDKEKIAGTILMTFMTIVAIGFSIIVIVNGSQGLLNEHLTSDPLSISLLVIMIMLAPLGALDSWFQGLFAVFASPRAIFFRRHILGPGLKLAAVLFVTTTNGSVQTLALGYLIGGLIGVASYVAMFLHILRSQGFLQYFNVKSIRFPVREIYGFSIPLLSTDILLILKSSMIVVLLGYFGTTTDVAEFRAVLPIAGLNLVVLQGFKFLYTPTAARLFARNDHAGINDLYWTTTAWIGLMTFPVFVISFSLAEPLTVFLFGDRYAESGIILAILSVGTFFNAALGFNAYTLRVYRKVRYIVSIDFISAFLSLGLSLWCIPKYGALGGAIAFSGALIFYNLLNHVGLRFGTGVELFRWQYFKVYISIVLGALGILLIQMWTAPPLIISIALAAVVSLVLLRLHAGLLQATDMFPELHRIPVLRTILAHK